MELFFDTLLPFHWSYFYFSWKSVFRISKKFQYFVVNSLPTLYFNSIFFLDSPTPPFSFFGSYWLFGQYWVIIVWHSLCFAVSCGGLLRRSASLIPSLFSCHLLERWLYLQGKLLKRDFRIFLTSEIIIAFSFAKLSHFGIIMYVNISLTYWQYLQCIYTNSFRKKPYLYWSKMSELLTYSTVL